MQGHGTCCPRKQDGENKDALLLRQPLTNAHLIPSANRPRIPAVARLGSAEVAGASEAKLIRCRWVSQEFPSPAPVVRPLPLAGEANSARVRRVLVTTASGI
jgi:hypothetical protein